MNTRPETYRTCAVDSARAYARYRASVAAGDADDRFFCDAVFQGQRASELRERARCQGEGCDKSVEVEVRLGSERIGLCWDCAERREQGDE